LEAVTGVTGATTGEGIGGMTEMDGLDEALRRLSDNLEMPFHPGAPPPTLADIGDIGRDVQIVFKALARYRFGPPWLVRTIDGTVRVKWRDVYSELQDRDFSTEAEARAFGTTMSNEPMKFGPDMETALLRAGKIQEANPGMSIDEAAKRAGIVTVTFKSPEAS
jgi:hypothetical protein